VQGRRLCGSQENMGDGRISFTSEYRELRSPVSSSASSLHHEAKHHSSSKTTVVMASVRARGDRRIARRELPTLSLPNPNSSFSEYLTAPST